MKKKVSVGSALVITVAIFIIVLIITKLFKLEDLPMQTIGVLFGGVITALITYFLLLGQTQAEENKERNVKVFQEKSERFNTFINKLWEIWDDRVVDLEELNVLIKLVSRDIVLYTKPETVDKILSNLITIAEQAKPDKTNRKDAEVTKLIQQSIFDIINELAKEIGLGGEIKPEIRKKLNQLEEKVVPFLIQKDFKNNYIQSVKETLENTEEIDISSIEYKNKFLWCKVKDSNLFLRVGPLERETNQGALIGAFVEFWGNRNFQQYRDASRGWRKDYIKGMRTHYQPNQIINFSDYETVEKMFYEQNNEHGTENQNDLAKKIIELYKSWKINGKNIEEIIEECTNK
jgi:hypothetical protein